MPATPPRHEPDRRVLLQLAAIIGVVLVMHLKIADLWIGAFAIIIFAVKVAALYRKAGPPNKIIIVLLTIASLGLVIFLYGGWNGQRAGISFLVLLLSLKFLESEALRDYFVVSLILYFLAASSFLFNSSIFNILLVTGFTLAITAILLQISDPSKQSTLKAFKQSTNIVVRALPLAILLFFLFPRVQSTFGFVPSLDRSQSNALSNALVAGEMATAAFDNRLVFQVNFRDGKIPERHNLYWRVKTMPVERNFTWEISRSYAQSEINTGNEMRKLESMNSQQAPNEYIYDILHEPTTDTLMPYLDYVAGTQGGLVRFDYSVLHTNTVGGSFSYVGRSTLSPSLTPNGALLRREHNLGTQSRPSARTLALLNNIQGQAQSDREIAELLLQYIKNNEFNYSLTPPSLGEDNQLDKFLFETKTGYCEHYASAFTTLMRWLGVPARVVLGYQGGEIISPDSNNSFLQVRYSDAHAWSEIWLNGQWQRMDPTAAISPERIDYGMQAMQQLWGDDLFGSNLSATALADYLKPTGSELVLKQIRDRWKSAVFQWNKWVVNYDAKTQLELLKNLGFKHGNHLVTLTILLFASAAILMLFYFFRLLPKPIKRSQAQTLYLKFIAKFKKLGLSKDMAETPSEFSARAIAIAPSHKQEIQEITSQYLQLRYGDSAPENMINTFKKHVQAFKLTKANLSDK